MDVINYELTDEQLRAIYAWIDAIPLSRPKRNIGRDFSDGVMLAEVLLGEIFKLYYFYLLGNCCLFPTSSRAP